MVSANDLLGARVKDKEAVQGGNPQVAGFIGYQAINTMQGAVKCEGLARYVEVIQSVQAADPQVPIRSLPQGIQMILVRVGGRIIRKAVRSRIIANQDALGNHPQV